MRAMSLRVAAAALTLPLAAPERPKRAARAASRFSVRSRESSWSDLSLMSAAFIGVGALLYRPGGGSQAGDNPGGDGQLGASLAQRLVGNRVGDAVDLEDDAAGADDALVALRVALALPHLHLRRLPGERPVRKNARPGAAVLAEVANHCAASSLDCVGLHPGVAGCLQPVRAERERDAARLRTVPDFPVLAAGVPLAVLNFLRKQHTSGVSAGQETAPTDWTSRWRRTPRRGKSRP